MTGEGDLVSPDGTAQPIDAADVDKVKMSDGTRPASTCVVGAEQALNHALTVSDVTALPQQVAEAPPCPLTVPKARQASSLRWPLPHCLLFLLDCLATVWIGGGLSRLRAAAACACTGAPRAAATPGPGPGRRRRMPPLQAALEPRLAFVKTGDEEVDRVSNEGLKGLTLILSDRTSARLAAPQAVSIDSDELNVYPLLYWPVLDCAQAPSDADARQARRYMKNGGTMFFDLRNGGLESGSTSDAAAPHPRQARRPAA